MLVTKMSALGNEILVLNLLTIDEPFSPEMVKKFSLKKKTSFDQLITIEPPLHPKNDFRCSIFNNDGSIAENCINGSRCIGKYVAKKKLLPQENFLVETIGGLWKLNLLANEIVSTEIECPNFEPKSLPFITEPSDKYYLEYEDKLLEIAIASLGNPHIVSFMNDIYSFPLKKWGDSLKNNPKFPKGANFGIASITSKNEINLRVHERGVGETLACGSGACAAVAIGNNLNLLDPKVKVNFSNGSLEVKYLATNKITVSGSAEFHDDYEI